MHEADDAFLCVHLDHAAAEITVARLSDNFQVSHLVAKFELCKNLSKDAKKLFVPKPLAKGLLARSEAGQTLRSVHGMQNSANILCSLLLRLSLQI